MVLSAIVAVTFLMPEKMIQPIVIGLDGNVIAKQGDLPVREGKKYPDGKWRWSDGEEYIPSSPQ